MTKEMSIHEQFAVNYCLSEFPEEYSFVQIINELESGDEGAIITPWETFEIYEPYQIAEQIISLTEDLERVFSPVSK